MEEEQIKTIRDWPEPQSVRDIQVFLGFANFYRRFIQGFSRLAALFTSMLKTTSAAGPAKQEHSGQVIQMEDQGEKELAQKSRKGQKRTKSKKWIRAKKAKAFRAKNLGQSGSFLTADVRRAFTELRQSFLEAPILNHFDPERHIRIETDASSYAIGGVLSQLTLDDSADGIR